MQFLGYSLDNLSLMALTLAIGFWWTTPLYF
jgi:multidrug efflux pump subunit AcrB